MTIRKYGRYWALTMPASWCVSAYTRRALPKSSGGCNGFPLPQHYPRKPATNPVHGRRADAWGSSDAASALHFLSPKLIRFARLKR